MTCHSDEANPFRSELAAFVWPSSAHAGHYFVAGFKGREDGGASVIYTRHAVPGDDVLCGDGRFLNPVWSLVERSMVVPPANWHFYPEHEGVSEVVASILSVEHGRVAELVN